MSRIIDLTAGTPQNSDVFIFDGASGTKKVAKSDLLGNYAEKASSPVSGDLASLDANGNPTDSGITAESVSSHLASQANPHNVTVAQIGAVPTSRTVNGKALSADIELDAEDVGAPTTEEMAEALEQKANIDGFYENMSVGNAEQLLASVYKTDKVPYLFRTAGGSLNIGDRETDEIHGGSLAWNQLVTGARESGTVGGFTVTAVSDYTSTFVGTLTSGANIRVSRNNNIGFAAGHKYFVSWGDSAPTGAVLYLGSDNLGSIAEKQAGVFVKASAENSQVGVFFVSGVETNFKVTLMLCDLTLMFGSQIADYIYTLEQSNAGAGVAWFRRYFPKPYYAYYTGNPISVKTSSHRMTGFNQWDEEWEIGGYNASTGAKANFNDRIRCKNPIKVVPDTTYAINRSYDSSTYYNYCWYDAEMNFIGGVSTRDTQFTSPSGACYLNFSMPASYGTTYKDDICISLYWDGERAGEYEPYKLNSYALDPDLELMGVYKLDGNNSLYCNGDIYTSDGTVRRRYGVVDLGEVTWGYYPASGSTPAYFNLYKDSIKTVTGKDMLRSSSAMMVCSKYAAVFPGFQSIDKTISQVTNSIRVVDSSAGTDPGAFKTAMSGVYLIYELAEETEETAEPYTNPQIVNDWGTEEYVDEREVAVPVGHVTQYMPDLKAKVEMSADSPDGDGDYILRHSNGLNVYVPLTKELPAAPSEDGTYTLSVTVSGGVATYSWVSA